MSNLLKVIIYMFIYFLLVGIAVVIATCIAFIEPHYRWKVYFKSYMLDYPQTKYFRTRIGAKRFYRKSHKECKWIYINRLKEGVT